MKTILLSNGIHGAIVDDEDYEKLIKYRWHASGVPALNSIVVQRNFQLSYNTVYVSMASEIFNDLKGMYDHRNRNGLDNRKENLRKTNHSSNMMNRAKYAGHYKSKYKGVTFNADNNKWRARITVQKRVINLGHFTSEIEAAITYNKAAILRHKEFAVLNVVC